MRARYHSMSLVVKLPGETSIVNFFLQDFVQEPIFKEVQKRQCVKQLTLRWSRNGSSPEIDYESILPQYLPQFPGLIFLQLRGIIHKRPTQRIAQRFGNIRSLHIALASCSFTTPTMCSFIIQCGSVGCAGMGASAVQRAGRSIRRPSDHLPSRIKLISMSRTPQVSMHQVSRANKSCPLPASLPPS